MVAIFVVSLLVSSLFFSIDKKSVETSRIFSGSFPSCFLHAKSPSSALPAVESSGQGPRIRQGARSVVGAAVCRRGGRGERSVMVVMVTAAVVGKDEKEVSFVSVVVVHSVAAAATGGGRRGRARRGVSHATEKERGRERGERWLRGWEKSP